MKRLVILLLALASLACDGPQYRMYAVSCAGKEHRVEARGYYQPNPRTRPACFVFFTRFDDTTLCDCTSVVPE